MSRLKISIVLMTIILGFCIFSVCKVNKYGRQLIEIVDNITYSLENNETEKALAEAEDMNLYWDKLRKKSSMLVQNEKLLSIESSITRIVPYIEADSDELMAELESVRKNIMWLCSSEIPYFRNIF